MNWQHLLTLVWLRWRLFVNMVRKGGTVNVVFWFILACGALLAAAGSAVALFLVGLFAFTNASPAVILLVWDGIALAFLFFWALGLLVELQRSEALSLTKFLHLPVSVTGAFLINYLSSLVTLRMIFFLPAMIGFSLGLVFGKGPAMLLLFPLVLAFLLMVTAVTYQFQGWLASLMVNKRRRRTVIVVVTMAFVVICQLPQLLNFLQPWQKFDQGEAVGAALNRMNAKIAKLNEDSRSEHLSAVQHQQRFQKIQDEYNADMKEIQEANRKRGEQLWQQTQEVAGVVNLVLPPGWLPLGAMGAAEGNPLPGLLGFLGMGLIGSASLGRSYRTTLGLYTGKFTAGKELRRLEPEKAAKAPKPSVPAGKRSVDLLEKKLPLLSEQAAAIALAGLRSLTRAPEAKMMLLSPIILLIVFGSMLLTQANKIPEALRLLLPSAAMAMNMLSMVGIAGNQFGFDRNGFRVYVLCSAPRRDILLGKNLALAPLALLLNIVMMVLLQLVFSVRLDRYLASFPQMVSMYLLFCLLGNCLAILAPMRIASGAFQPSNPKLVPILLQLAFMVLFPAAMLPALLPLGIELGLEALGSIKGMPVSLTLSLVECVIVVFVYRFLLGWQGIWLQSREQVILEIVATKQE